MVLGIQKELESRGYKGLLVATALNHDMAVQAIWTILNTNKEHFVPLVRQETKRMILGALDPEKQKRTLVLSGVCEDRADSVMLMLESGSIRGVGLRALEETDSKVVAIRNLQVDADLCEI
ncbi:uncharacterized protein LOC111715743 [Eurytemora carolleeae]|uniref:uncharacterized protein LOC111715743 n=1 Tax=Eurytemora carolleeae TaxID=1294199 RepID=UPI000C77C69D|nr:uncharacterized protein LOC111715743 [Eurytemora carolleeae]|eukprot:XP_023346885.1 uncharacterized protein LOC111715743 [Eurytemora affinis]